MRQVKATLGLADLVAMSAPFTGRALAGIAGLVVIAGIGAAWELGHHSHGHGTTAQVNTSRAAAGDVSLKGCSTGWTCVSSYAQQLGITVDVPSSGSTARFRDAHLLGQGGVEYSFRLGTGEQVDVFALPTSSPGASSIPGAPRSAVVVQGHRGAWLPNKFQDILTWQQAGLRYRAWYPSSVSEQVAVSTTNDWIAT